jgi:hypothetical protein
MIFHIFKLNNLKVIHDLHSQCLTQILSKTTSNRKPEGVQFKPSMPNVGLAKWSILCKPKSVGGMGIIDLDTQNKCLLSKWIVKLLNEDGLWQQVLKKKYLKGRTLS